MPAYTTEPPKGRTINFIPFQPLENLENARFWFIKGSSQKGTKTIFLHLEPLYGD